MAKPKGNSLPAETTAPADMWDQLEKITKVLSMIAIPVILAIIGWLVQNSLSERSVGQEYVKLALSILREPKDRIEPSLRDWAVDLLNHNSSTKFSAHVIQALKAGQATLPAQLGALLGAGGGGGSLAISPDGKRIATGHADGTARLWDTISGKPVAAIRGHSDAVTSIAFSADGLDLLTGSLDKTARLWDVATGSARAAPLRGHTDAIIGVAFAPDGASIFTRSLDRTVRVWSRDGRSLTTFEVPE